MKHAALIHMLVEAAQLREQLVAAEAHVEGLRAVIRVAERPIGKPEQPEGQTVPASAGDLPLVAGDVMTLSLADMEHRCLVFIGEEQQKPLPDITLIGILCEAVRLTREHVSLMRRNIPAVPASAPPATHFQHYYSTYCLQGDHEYCRRTLTRTTGSPCLCECHKAGGKQDA